MRTILMLLLCCVSASAQILPGYQKNPLTTNVFTLGSGLTLSGGVLSSSGGGGGSSTGYVFNANQFGASSISNISLKSGVQMTNAFIYGATVVSNSDGVTTNFIIMRPDVFYGLLPANQGALWELYGQGNTLAADFANGRVQIGTNAAIVNQVWTPTAVPFIGVGAANQVVSLAQWKDSGGNVLAEVGSNGIIRTVTNSFIGYGLIVSNNFQNFGTTTNQGAMSLGGGLLVAVAQTNSYLTASRALVTDANKALVSATGTPDGTKFLRDDNTYAVPPGTGGNTYNPNQFDVAGAIDILSGALVSNLIHYAIFESRGSITNTGALNQTGGVTNWANVLNVGAVENRGTVTNTGATTVGAATNFGPTVLIGSFETRGTVTNAGAINNAVGATNWANTVHVGAVENRSTVTNTGSINNASGVTNWGSSLLIGSLETRSTVTNAGALNNAAAVTNWGTTVLNAMTASRALVTDANRQVASATGTPDGTKYLRDDNTYAVPPGTATFNPNQFDSVGAIDILSGALVSNLIHYAIFESRGSITNTGAFNQTGGMTNWANVLNIGAVENRSTVTNSSAVNTAGGVTNFGPTTLVGALETRSTVTNAGAINNAGPETNWGQATFSGPLVYTWTAISALDIDWAAGNARSKTLTANSTFTFSNLADDRDVSVNLLQDATGTWSVTWPGSIIWVNSTNQVAVPTVNTNAGFYSHYHFWRRSGTLFAEGPSSAASIFLVNLDAGTTSADLAAHITDETGTGGLVFSNAPTISSPTVLNWLSIQGPTTNTSTFTNQGAVNIAGALNTFSPSTNWGTIRNKANVTNDAVLQQAGAQTNQSTLDITGALNTFAPSTNWSTIRNKAGVTNDSNTYTGGAATNNSSLDVAGIFNTFSTVTNWSTVRNKAGITNDSNERVGGAAEFLSTVTNSLWVNTAGGVTNYSTMMMVGLQTNQGTLDVTGPLVSHVSATNRGTLRQMGGQTNDNNLRVVGASEFQGTITNSAALNGRRQTNWSDSLGIAPLSLFGSTNAFFFPTNASDGFVLTSDAVGNGRWLAAVGGGGGSSTGYVFNPNQFTALNVSNISISAGALLTNITVQGWLSVPAKQTNTGSLTVIGPLEFPWATVGTNLDWSQTNSVSFTLTSNTVFTFAGTNDGRELMLALKQDATGTRTATFTNGIVWLNSTNQSAVPAINTNASQYTLIHFWQQGATIFADGPAWGPSRYVADLQAGTAAVDSASAIPFATAGATAHTTNLLEWRVGATLAGGADSNGVVVKRYSSSAVEHAAVYTGFMQTLGGTVTNITTTTNTIFGTIGRGSLTIPGDFWKQNRALEVNIDGKYWTGTTPGNCRFIIMLKTSSATNTLDSKLFTPVASKSGDSWYANFKIVCRTNSGTGALSLTGTAVTLNAGTPTYQNLTNTITIIDTTIPYTFDMGWTNGAATDSFWADNAYGEAK